MLARLISSLFLAARRPMEGARGGRETNARRDEGSSGSFGVRVGARGDWGFVYSIA